MEVEKDNLCKKRQSMFLQFNIFWGENQALIKWHTNNKMGSILFENLFGLHHHWGVLYINILLSVTFLIKNPTILKFREIGKDVNEKVDLLCSQYL